MKGKKVFWIAILSLFVTRIGKWSLSTSRWQLNKQKVVLIFFPSMKWLLIFRLIYHNTGFWDISGAKLSDPRVTNPIYLFSLVSRMKQIVSELGLEHLTSMVRTPYMIINAKSLYSNDFLFFLSFDSEFTISRQKNAWILL